MLHEQLEELFYFISASGCEELSKPRQRSGQQKTTLALGDVSKEKDILAV